jgi:hypothetical protein
MPERLRLINFTPFHFDVNANLYESRVRNYAVFKKVRPYEKKKNYITQEINEVYSACASNKIMTQSTMTARLSSPLRTVAQPSIGEHGCKM